MQRHIFLGSTLGCVPSLPLGTWHHILIVDTYVAALSLSWPRAARRAATPKGGARRSPPHFRYAAPLTRTLAGCAPPAVERFPFVRQSEVCWWQRPPPLALPHRLSLGRAGGVPSHWFRAPIPFRGDPRGPIGLPIAAPPDRPQAAGGERASALRFQFRSRLPKPSTTRKNYSAADGHHRLRAEYTHCCTAD